MTSALALPSSAPAPPDGKRGDRERFHWGSMVLLLPGAALLAGLFLFPVGYAAYLGFSNLSLVGPHAVDYGFTGLTNLRQLAHDSLFWHSALRTAVFVLGSGVVGVTLLGLVL